MPVGLACHSALMTVYIIPHCIENLTNPDKMYLHFLTETSVFGNLQYITPSDLATITGNMCMHRVACT